jgi:hypothetical protein
VPGQPDESEDVEGSLLLSVSRGREGLAKGPTGSHAAAGIAGMLI